MKNILTMRKVRYYDEKLNIDGIIPGNIKIFGNTYIEGIFEDVYKFLRKSGVKYIKSSNFTIVYPETDFDEIQGEDKVLFEELLREGKILLLKNNVIMNTDTGEICFPNEFPKW